jgi:hypothetical protein
LLLIGVPSIAPVRLLLLSPRRVFLDADAAHVHPHLAQHPALAGRELDLVLARPWRLCGGGRREQQHQHQGEDRFHWPLGYI